MQILIRDARFDDLPAIDAIYIPYIAASTCTYQLEPDPPEARVQWWREHEGRYPVLVAERVGDGDCVRDGECVRRGERTADIRRPAPEIVAWAALSRYSPRGGYRFTAEDSIYLRADVQGRGLGKRLLAELIERGRAAGFHTILAKIAHDQPASIRLHAALGFVEAGRLRDAGFKFGGWLTTIYMQRML